MTLLRQRDLEVLHIISGDLWAGAEVQVFHTLADLRLRGTHRFAVVVFNDGLLLERLRERGVETVLINERTYSFPAMAIRLAHLIVRYRPAVLHVHAFKEHILGALANVLSGGRCALLRTFHGMSEVPRGLPLGKRLKSGFIHGLERRLLGHGKSGRVVAVSKDLESYLKREYPGAMVVQIYNGVPGSVRQYPPRDAVRIAHGVGQGVFWIGSAARLVEPKNLGMLIDVGVLLNQKGCEFKISIFGEGPLRQQLQERIELLQLGGRVCLEGFKHDVDESLSALDAFVICSHHEGLPMSLLEAAMLGVPVVGTAVGGVTEVIRHDHSGLLVRDDDRTGLAEALQKLSSAPALGARLATNARNDIERVFSIQRTNTQLCAVYDSILEGC